MTDDLKAAIERYKKHLAVDWSDSASIATSPYCDVNSKRFSVVEIQADESAIIDAYLAELAERERREVGQPDDLKAIAETMHRLTSELHDSSSWASLERAENFCKRAGRELGAAASQLNAWRAERERREAERALPIDEHWLLEIGFEWENNPCGFGQYVLRDRELRVAGPRGDWQWWIGSVLCSHPSKITTRGQLLDLMAALDGKGGRDAN